MCRCPRRRRTWPRSARRPTHSGAIGTFRRWLPTCGHRRLHRRRSDAMGDRTLIRGGSVLTQDDSLGELPRADILVEGDRIAEVGPELSADGARVIDAEGDIVIPGFV